LNAHWFIPKSGGNSVAFDYTDLYFLRMDWSSPTEETIEAWLVREIAGRLGCSSEEIDVRKPFASYGLDSVQAVGMSGALENWLGVRVPATLAWDFPTIESLAPHLAELVQQDRERERTTES
jgi:acyl carrier protein